MRADRPLLLLLAALTAGCADPEPFVDHGNPTFTVQVDKPRDSVLETGQVRLCHSAATPWAEVEALARERCAAHGLQAAFLFGERHQCRATSPHRATFQCYDPEMLTERGTPVNPFDPAAVATWEKRTGKTAKPHNFLTAPGGAAANPTNSGTAANPTNNGAAANPANNGAAPAQAPVAAPVQAPLVPLTPDSVADRPAFQPYPPRPATPAPAAPAAEAYPVDNFTLPQGSWGDHFQE